MYDLEIKPEADEIFKKLLKRNRKQLEIIHNKIEDIRTNPEHDYKFLRKPLQSFNMVHIDRHFVLIFKYNHLRDIILFKDYEHHDKIYSKYFVVLF